jgi:hypothetical protein
MSVDKTAKPEEKLDHPADHFASPGAIANDASLSPEQKKKALATWEQDAHQLATASNEGMPGSEEGRDPEDHNRLGEVVRAKETIGLKPKHKPAH